MKERSDDAPKGRALTMTDEQEARERFLAMGGSGKFYRAWEEVDATRARVAELERDNALIASAVHKLSMAAAVAEAECADLRAALTEAVGVCEDDLGWEWSHDGGSVRLRAILSRPSGDYAALRAMMFQTAQLVAADAEACADYRPTDEALWRFVARLLPATQAQERAVE